MKNPVSTRRPFSTSAVCLLAFASTVAAQNAQTLEQRLADLERRLDASPQGKTEASTDNSLLQMFRGGDATYSPGRGLTITAQEAEQFSINISGQVQPSWTYTDNDTAGPAVTDTQSFNLRSTRLRLEGNVFDKDITYFVQMDPSLAGSNLVDGWGAWRVQENINVRFGQQKFRSSLQADASLSDTDLEMANNSIATNFFAGRRGTGVLIEGRAVEGKLNWHAGAMNNQTAGLATSNPAAAAFAAAFGAPGQANPANENELNYTVGASYGSSAGNSESWSEGDLAHSGELDYIAGASLYIGNDEIGGADSDMTTINAFVGLKTGKGIAVQGEVFVRQDDPTGGTKVDSNGFYGQVSYTLAPREDEVQWGGVLRYSMIDFDNNIESSEISAGVNAYYHEHRLKTQLQVAMLEDDIGTQTFDTMRFDLLFTLMF